MYQITLPTSMRRWTVHLAGDVAVFVRASLAEDYPLAHTLPRVWDRHGLGLPEHDVAEFTSTLGEVMKTPTFWRAYRGPGRLPAQGWAQPHTDPEDGFVYVSGPCGDASQLVGYRPVCRFTIALADVRGLRIRLAAHVKIASSGPDRSERQRTAAGDLDQRAADEAVKPSSSSAPASIQTSRPFVSRTAPATGTARLSFGDPRRTPPLQNSVRPGCG